MYLLRGGAGGKFGKAEELKDAKGLPLRPGNSDEAAKGASVVAFDLDGDKDLDLLMSNAAGAVYLSTNRAGTPGAQSENDAAGFSEPLLLKLKDEPLRHPAGGASAAMVDWDGDGLLDLVVGGADGSVLLFNSSATVPGRGDMSFQGSLTLVPPAPKEKAAAPRPGAHARISLADWNNDRRPDLLVTDVQDRTARLWVYHQK